MAYTPKLSIASTLPLLHTSAKAGDGGSASIPILGLGVYRVKPSSSTPSNNCFTACQAALEAGYRHIDTARLYRNEPDVLEAVQTFCEDSSKSTTEINGCSERSEDISKKGDFTRAKIFLTTKIRESTGDIDRDYQAARKCVARLSGASFSSENQGINPEKTGEELPVQRETKRRKVSGTTSTKLDATPYVDLFLIHQPMPTLQERTSLWQALERLHREGRARNIGVSNYRIEHIEEMREYAEIWPPSVNQIEVHPWFQQKELTSYCASHGIVVEAFAPLAQGKHFAKTPNKEDEKGDVLECIARKHNKTPAQVLIRWSLQTGHVVLPKSSKPERIRENADVFEFTLDKEDMEALNELDAGDRSGATYKWNKA